MVRWVKLVLLAGLVACKGDRPKATVVPATASALAEHPRFSEADYRRQADQAVARIPADFTVVIEPPFVVVGDEAPPQVRRRAEVVRWTVAMLRRDFFSEDPTRIITIWLFGSARSYRDWALALFGDVPTTPYGYYSADNDALIMNIRTGGGTLVHEIVHPFVEANLPGCPAWVDEGLGSLFEQSAERDGQMVGLINWRLPGLQRAIEQDAVPPLRWLAEASDEAFYGHGSGVHYAEARYLMYYLQEAGVLQRFVADVEEHRDDDPSAYRALSRAVGESDMVAFQQHWERWVSYLHPR